MKAELHPRLDPSYESYLDELLSRQNPVHRPGLPDWSAYNTDTKLRLRLIEELRAHDMLDEYRRWFAAGPTPGCEACTLQRLPDLLPRLTAMERRWEEESREKARRWTLLRRQVTAFIEDPGSSAHLQVAKGNFWSKKYGWHVGGDHWWLTPDGRLVTLDEYDAPHGALGGLFVPELKDMKDIQHYETILRELFKRCGFTPPQA